MTDTATATVIDATHDETNEWKFEGRVRVRLSNPDGTDVIMIRSYRAEPKFDDLTTTEDSVHETTDYWWPDSYPSEGDSPFHDAMTEWEPSSDLDDHDELMEECIQSATHDPQAELEGLQMSNRVSERSAAKLSDDTED